MSSVQLAGGTRLQELCEVDLAGLPHLREPFYTAPATNQRVSGELPYHDLQGPGLERLCFELLVAKGYRPRYFGRNGEAQYGIDLIVSDGESCQVYQCKNVAEFSSQALSNWLKKFSDEWLVKRPHLPRPNQFIIVCPLPIRDRDEPETAKQRFFEQHGVTVEICHKEWLDAELAHRPDIVADLFSEAAAERFCHLSDWNQGLFRPVKEHSGERRAIDRFLKLRSRNRIVRDEMLALRFADVIATNGVVLIAGRSGSGKTITSLDLATSLDGGIQRVFYVSMRHEASEDHLVAGIERRSGRPTIFVLDDVHLGLDRVDRVLDRVAHLTRGGRVRIALVSQTGMGEEDLPGLDGVDVLERFREDELVLDLAPDLGQYSEILRRAGVIDVSEKRLEKLFHLTARDLVLLDAALEHVSSAEHIDDLSPETLFRATLRRYFRKEVVHAPDLRRLAAAAQFDLAISVADLSRPFEPEYADAVNRLTVVVGRPASRAFVHASAAEVVHRALCWAAAADWEGAAAVDIASFLTKAGDGELLAGVAGFAKNRLKLGDDSGVKQAVLSDLGLLSRLERIRRQLPPTVLSLFAFINRNVRPVPPFANWLAERIAEVIARRDAPAAGLATIGLWLRSLRLADFDLADSMEARIAEGELLDLIAERGTLIELLGILQYSSSAFAERLIASLDRVQTNRLVDRIIAESRSIGTLNLALRELGQRDKEQRQLRALEEKIGTEAMAKLIAERGTLTELLRILRYSSSGFAERLIASLNPVQTNRLVDRTIAESRSIGTLNLALRELGQRDKEQRQLRALEDKIGTEAMAKLIAERGTLVELLGILRYSSSGFSERLITSLDPVQTSRLVDRTIAESRSIGTLSLALRELGQRDKEQRQLRALEEKIGTEAMAKLIAERGTLVELLKFLEHSSTGFAERLIAGLEPAQTNRLLERTIAESRSIGTLDLALRELGQRDKDQRQLRALEEKMGTDAMAKLIAQRGTLVELLRILQHSSTGFAERLIASLEPSRVDDLVQKAVNRQVSIGTINYSFADLRHRLPNAADQLESLLGPERLWELVNGCGDLNHLAYILDGLGAELRSEFLRPDIANEERWVNLCCRSDYYDLCRFIRDGQKAMPSETSVIFESVAARAAFLTVVDTAWDAFASGLAVLESIPDSPVREALQAAAASKMERAESFNFRELDLIEAASGIDCIRRLRPDVWTDFANNIEDHLPPQRNWPKDYELLIAGGILMNAMRSPNVPPPVAERLLREFAPLTQRTNLSQTDPKVAFLFVWNSFALWYERARPIADRFDSLQAPEFWVELLGILRRRAHVRASDEDNLNLFALAGALVFLASQSPDRVRNAIRPKGAQSRRLMDRISELSMVPAFLALHGLALLSQEESCFPPLRRYWLVKRAGEYADRGPAIDWLCDWLRKERYAGRR